MNKLRIHNASNSGPIVTNDYPLIKEEKTYSEDNRYCLCDEVATAAAQV